MKTKTVMQQIYDLEKRLDSVEQKVRRLMLENGKKIRRGEHDALNR